jgi:hypothetical protein
MLDALAGLSSRALAPHLGQLQLGPNMFATQQISSLS